MYIEDNREQLDDNKELTKFVSNLIAHRTKIEAELIEAKKEIIWKIDELNSVATDLLKFKDEPTASKAKSSRIKTLILQ